MFWGNFFPMVMLVLCGALGEYGCTFHGLNTSGFVSQYGV